MDNNPSTYYHTEPVKDFNAAIRAQIAGGTAAPDLTEEGLLAAARKEMGRNARYQEVKKAFIDIQPIYSEAFDAHPMDADWPEEEMMLLNHSFCSHSWMGNFGIPEFYEWYHKADLTYGYRYMAELMSLISWSRGDPEDKPWLLKDPEHMLRLEVLMNVFPDAKAVFTNRGPRSTVASVMALMWFIARQHSEGPCRGRIRAAWLRFCEYAARRCHEQRNIIPPSQQIAALYEDVNKDRKIVMRRIYALAEMPFTTGRSNCFVTGWLKAKRKNAMPNMCTHWVILASPNRALMREWGLCASKLHI